MYKLDALSARPLVIGSLNRSLVDVTGFGLVATLLGAVWSPSRVAFVVIGGATLYQAVQWLAFQRRWLAPSRAGRA